MTREENYQRGAAAEVRIMKKLQTVAEVEQSGKGVRYPDLTMTLNGSTYAVECKSVLSFHDGGEVGCAKISSTEFTGMNKLEQQGLIPCLIVEIRPRKGTSVKPCFFIPGLTCRRNSNRMGIQDNYLSRSIRYSRRVRI